MYLDKYKNVIYIVINMFILNYFIVFFVLIYASYTDYTKREIPNWLSFGLILFGLISNFIYSLFIGNFYYFLIVLGLTIATFILFYVFWIRNAYYKLEYASINAMSIQVFLSLLSFSFSLFTLHSQCSIQSLSLSVIKSISLSISARLSISPSR